MLQNPVLESASSESRSDAGLLAVGQDAYHRDERVRKFRVVPFILVSKGNNKIAVLSVFAFSQARCNLGFDAPHDLLE
jgi:hypothetical protein